MFKNITTRIKDFLSLVFYVVYTRILHLYDAGEDYTGKKLGTVWGKTTVIGRLVKDLPTCIGNGTVKLEKWFMLLSLTKRMSQCQYSMIGLGVKSCH